MGTSCELWTFVSLQSRCSWLEQNYCTCIVSFFKCGRVHVCLQTGFSLYGDWLFPTPHPCFLLATCYESASEVTRQVTASRPYTYTSVVVYCIISMVIYATVLFQWKTLFTKVLRLYINLVVNLSVRDVCILVWLCSPSSVTLLFVPGLVSVSFSHDVRVY